MVWAKGNVSNSPGQATVTLKYNTVTKDTVVVGTESNTTEKHGFALHYTETPGAGTQNITVESGNSLANVVIMVMKF
jgi:hypothetical protein